MSPSDPHPSTRTFTPAREEAEVAANATSSAQTEDPAYRLAFQDMDFLLREDLRPVRFQLELLKPELLLDEAKIASTFVFYGSAPIPAPARPGRLLPVPLTPDCVVDEAKIASAFVFYGAARIPEPERAASLVTTALTD